MQYCSLQHWSLLPSPVASTAGCCFCFGSIPSFFLELFLHWSPVAYWAPTDLWCSSFSVLSFCLFILSMGSQGKNPEVVCLSLLQWTTFFRTLHRDPSILGGPTGHGSYFHWVRQGCCVCVIRWLVFCGCGFSACLPSDGEGWEAYGSCWWERWTEGETGSCSDGWGCA